MQSGDIAHSDATALWDKEVSKLHADTVDVLPSTPYREAAVRRAKQVQFAGFEDVAKVVEAANRQQYGADAATTLDRLGKLSTLPDANLDSIFSSADSLFPTLAQRAGMSQTQASKALQEWKDSTRFRRAQIDLTAVRRDPEGLDQFITRLDKGDLVGSLDPDKRMALVKEAEGYRWQMDQLQQHQADKREKLAERAVGRAQQQIEAGVPLTADGWQGLRNLVEGTSFAPDFNRLVTSEREVQGVLRMPIDQQEQYLQQRESTLMQQAISKPRIVPCWSLAVLIASTIDVKPASSYRTSPPCSTAKRYWPGATLRTQSLAMMVESSICIAAASRASGEPF